MKYVYILKSENLNKYYTGVTDNVEDRLKSHNNGEVQATKSYKPWALKNYFYFENSQKAFEFERYLKSGSGRAFAKKHF